jgi:hypothetical protein
MNILAELHRMGVSMVCAKDGIKMVGERAREAAGKFKAQRQNLLDEIKMYEPSLALMHGVEHSVIDQCRAIASAWDWSEGDWGLYWDRTEDMLGNTIDFTQAVNDIFTAEQITHPERYA